MCQCRTQLPGEKSLRQTQDLPGSCRSQQRSVSHIPNLHLHPQPGEESPELPLLSFYTLTHWKLTFETFPACQGDYWIKTSKSAAHLDIKPPGITRFPSLIGDTRTQNGQKARLSQVRQKKHPNLMIWWNSVLCLKGKTWQTLKLHRTRFLLTLLGCVEKSNRNFSFRNSWEQSWPHLESNTEHILMFSSRL